jgi:hypothetical protein
MGEKGNALSSAQGAASASGTVSPGVADQVVGVAGDIASTASGVVVGATTDLAQEHVRGRLEGVVHRGEKDAEREVEKEAGADDGAPEGEPTESGPAGPDVPPV